MEESCIEKLLDLKEFDVIGVEPTKEEVRIELQRKATSATCPRCKADCPFEENQRRSRIVRDLPILERHTRLVLWLRRARCAQCKKRFFETSQSLPAPKRWTERLYQTACYEALRGSALAQLAQRYGIPARTLFRWTFERSRGGRQRKLGSAIGVDEYARSKGHSYNTSIVDLDTRRVITTFKGRDKATVVNWFRSRPAEEIAAVKSVVIDMSKPFAAALREVFGEHVVIIDRFHVMQQAVDALDQVLRSVAKKLDKDEAKELKKMRRRWLKSADKLEVEEFVQRATWLVRFPELREVLDWIQQLRHWFERKYTEPARKALLALIEKAEGSVVESLHKIAGTLTRWFDPILRFIRHRYTNGFTEGINNKIKLIQRMAFGLRNEHNRKKRILAWCGRP